MAVKRPMRVLGFMTGTSLDAVDMAVLETDGETIQGFGPAGEKKLDPATRSVLEEATAAALAWPWGAPRPAIFAEADRVIADEHLIAARGFMADHALTANDLDLVGFHGQTVLHEPPGRIRAEGRTIQLGDAARLARGLGLPVAYDFRTADVAAGGQGAPLAPIYHRALARWSGRGAPVAVLNLGGVANITFIQADGGLEALDTGPANGMLDQLTQGRGLGRCDVDGALALAGEIDQTALSAYLGHPYLTEKPPKSLDRYQFSLAPVAELSSESAAATLTAFTVGAIVAAIAWPRREDRPTTLIACGGGRHNPAIMQGLRRALGSMTVMTAEDAGWRGDSIEAEAFAYLAARTAMGLPISFPNTTGVPAEMTGGRLVQPG